jgi:hypothetical protein
MGHARHITPARGWLEVSDADAGDEAEEEGEDDGSEDGEEDGVEEAAGATVAEVDHEESADERADDADDDVHDRAEARAFISLPVMYPATRPIKIQMMREWLLTWGMAISSGRSMAEISNEEMNVNGVRAWNRRERLSWPRAWEFLARLESMQSFQNDAP